MMKNKLPVFLSALLVISLGLNVYLYQQFSSQTIQTSTVRSEYETLGTSLHQLETEVSSLNSLISDLKRENEQLQQTNEELQQECDRLQKELEDAQKNFEEASSKPITAPSSTTSSSSKPSKPSSSSNSSSKVTPGGLGDFDSVMKDNSGWKEGDAIQGGTPTGEHGNPFA